jgi:hypothetical protein
MLRPISQRGARHAQPHHSARRPPDPARLCGDRSEHACARRRRDRDGLGRRSHGAALAGVHRQRQGHVRRREPEHQADLRALERGGPAAARRRRVPHLPFRPHRPAAGDLRRCADRARAHRRAGAALCAARPAHDQDHRGAARQDHHGRRREGHHADLSRAHAGAQRPQARRIRSAVCGLDAGALCRAAGGRGSRRPSCFRP